MAQLHLYVPDATAEILRRKAKGRRLTLSRYLAEVVSREVGGDEWPPERFFDDVLGA